MSAYPPPTELLPIYNPAFFPSSVVDSDLSAIFLKKSGGTMSGILTTNLGIVSNSDILNSGDYIIDDGTYTTTIKDGTLVADNVLTLPITTGTLALSTDLPTDYVDLTTDQTVGGVKSFTDVMKQAAGVNTNPSYGFSTETGLGMYRSAANTLAFAASGSQRLVVNNSFISTLGPISMSAALVGSGTAGSPAVQINDTNSGLYRIASDRIGISTGGSRRLDISNTQFEVTTQVLLDDDLLFVDEDTKISRPSAGILNIDADITETTASSAINLRVDNTLLQSLDAGILYSATLPVGIASPTFQYDFTRSLTAEYSGNSLTLTNNSVTNSSAISRGNITQGLPTYTEAFFDGAVSKAYLDRSIIASDPIDTALAGSSVTCSVWFRPNAIIGDLFVFIDTAYSKRLRLYFDVNRLYYLADSGSNYSQFYMSDFEVGKLYHICVTHGASGITVYRNGEPASVTYSIGNASTAYQSLTSMNELYIGAYDPSFAATGYFDGNIRSCQMWNSILTAREIVDIYKYQNI